jgi:hypothetical protein
MFSAQNSPEKAFGGITIYVSQFIDKNRYGTKIKNCSGFMRVHRILKVWSLLTTKIIISPK